MPDYRRTSVAGASYFFTVNCAKRHKQHLLTDNMDLLRNVIRNVKQAHPFTIDAMVVLPEHLHCIWTLPPDDADYKTRWALIKAGFSRGILPIEPRSASRQGRGERGIWQRRFWEHLIRNERDLKSHIDYIHWNPVKHGWVQCASDWPYSSLHRFVRRGIYPPDWACEGDDMLDAGE